MKRPSIGDVARHAGVSTATVARALNAPGTVAEKTRRKVQQAVDALHYVQSETARNFKKQRASAVLVVASDIGNIYYSEIFRGIQRRAEASNYAISIANPSPGGTREMILSTLRTARVDGVIILSGHKIADADLGLLRQLYAGPLPLVALSEERGSLKIPHVLIDNERAGYLAGRHLVAMGHWRIGHVQGPHDTPVRRARRNGLHRALAEAGLSLDADHLFEGGFDAEGGRAAAERFLTLKERPTAVFCANDEAAMGFITLLHRHGIAVPRDLSVMGFDDIALADTYVPALTTVHQPREEMGREAMGLLLDIIEKRLADPVPVVELPVHLMPRDSVRAFDDGSGKQ